MVPCVLFDQFLDGWINKWLKNLSTTVEVELLTILDEWAVPRNQQKEFDNNKWKMIAMIKNNIYLIKVFQF